MTAIMIEPDIQQKLAILSDEAGDEQVSAPVVDSIRDGLGHATGFIYNAQQEGGGTTRLFKVLQTNACKFACPHCFTYT
jgi:predicted DNA-binding helix-hairpin-helix protein